MSVFLLYAGMRVQMVAYKKKLDTAKLEQRSLVYQLQKFREKMLMGQVLQNKPYWEEVLKELSNIVPRHMHLVKLTMDQDIIKLEGVIVPKGQTVESTLSNFMLMLENGMFKNVSLVMTRKMSGNLSKSEFEIKCEIE